MRSAGIAALRASRPPVPLLFVPGHLGSHQQMRSLASESSRELVRRFSAQSKEPWDLWIEWSAVDFAAEPSAFEPRVLGQQAAFTAAVLRRLWESGGAAAGRMVVVGYSMGGLVVEEALRLLQASGNAPFGKERRTAEARGRERERVSALAILDILHSSVFLG